MSKSLPLMLRHAMYNLRGGFLIRPLTIASALGCVGMFLSWLEEEFPVASAWVPTLLFPSHADPQVAQLILGGIAASIMTVVSIVFAILLMTLTLGAMVLALVCVGLLLFFIHHISQAISVNHIVDRIAEETEAMIDDLMPWPHRLNHLNDPEPLRPNPSEVAVLSDASGYIRFIDKRRLVALAKHYHVSIRVLRRVGHFVPAGIPLVMVSKGNRLPPAGTAELLAAFDIGPTRTLQQDVEFGVLQIVDVALKAISPAVNDPTTAITCVDQLSRILIRFVSREPPEELLYDPPGIVR